jgi:class 3 adenylate cyclase/tetratricopeptide (TPR) repeat protein
VRDIGAWLAGLGLSQYQSAFEANAIDVAVLADLTDEDLEKLGVLLGHRKRMQRAIAELEVGPLIPAPTDIAERRLLTVMFVDLVGSTALSAQLDPEDLHEVIGAYHRRVAAMVQSLNGYVAKYMGDGVLIYFGYPQAHEDDVERAVRAALALTESAPVHPPCRIGIETGMVVVGDLVGSGEAQERGVVGETPNLAARLQAIAEPDSVVIGPGTRRLLGTLFDLHDLGTVTVPGIAAPLRAWRVLRPASIDSRFEAFRGSTPLSPLIGREDDLAILLRRWERSSSGQGQLVLLSGEPGIGKSRLTASLLDVLASESHTRLRYYCSPHHAESALFPFITQLERAAGFERGDPPGVRLDRLDAVLAATTTIEDRSLIAELLALPNTGRYPSMHLTPQRRRQRTLEALALQLDALAAERPVLMIFEDAHWADPTSLELLGQTVERVRRLPVMMVVTFRPEFAPPWSGQPQVTSLTLSRLPMTDAIALVRRVAGSVSLPETILTEIAERTDGVPLFIEELTKATIEAGNITQQVASVTGAAAAVPATLYASLMARLDRLQPGKKIAQIGAAIGREFTHDVLAAVAARDPKELHHALGQLIEAGLVFSRGTPPDTTYLFKHALVQDVAYGTLLRTRRQDLHARIARVLEAGQPEIMQTQPELLARHYTRAGMSDRAVVYWLRAGERAAAMSANDEAINHLNVGIEALGDIPDSPSRLQVELDLNSALGAVLLAQHGYGADTVGRTVTRSLDLSRRMGDRLKLAAVLYQVWLYRYTTGDLADAEALGAELLSLPEHPQDPTCNTAAHMAAGLIHFFYGRPSEGSFHFSQGAQRSGSLAEAPVAFRYGMELAAAALAYQGWCLAILGYPEQALIQRDKALEVISRTNHAYTTTRGLFWCSAISAVCRDWQMAFALGDRGARAGNEQGFALGAASASVPRNVARAILERDPRALTDIQDSVARYENTGARVQMSILLAMYAEALLALDQQDAASRVLADAIRSMEDTGERTYEAKIYRLQGEVFIAGASGDAEPYFHRAIEVARRQQAKLFELRSARSLARLWRMQGKAREARDLLAPVSAWFTEGRDTPDLLEAKALLVDLA